MESSGFRVRRLLHPRKPALHGDTNSELRRACAFLSVLPLPLSCERLSTGSLFLRGQSLRRSQANDDQDYGMLRYIFLFRYLISEIMQCRNGKVIIEVLHFGHLQ